MVYKSLEYSPCQKSGARNASSKDFNMLAYVVCAEFRIPFKPLLCSFCNQGPIPFLLLVVCLYMLFTKRFKLKFVSNTRGYMVF